MSSPPSPRGRAIARRLSRRARRRRRAPLRHRRRRDDLLDGGRDLPRPRQQRLPHPRRPARHALRLRLADRAVAGRFLRARRRCSPRSTTSRVGLDDVSDLVLATRTSITSAASATARRAACACTPTSSTRAWSPASRSASSPRPCRCACFSSAPASTSARAPSSSRCTCSPSSCSTRCRSIALLVDGDEVNGYVVHHAPGHCPGQICMQVHNVLLTDRSRAAAHHAAPVAGEHHALDRARPLPHLAREVPPHRRRRSGAAGARGADPAPVAAHHRDRAFHRARLEKVRALCAAAEDDRRDRARAVRRAAAATGGCSRSRRRRRTSNIWRGAVRLEIANLERADARAESGAAISRGGD